MQTHTIEGGGGLKLHVREWGNPDAPAILFLHGWSQDHQCWFRQFESPLAERFRLVAMDLRGHGQSEAPLEPMHYADSGLWADDVAAVLAALNLQQPVLVGWSYGGLVIGDYLRKYGEGSIAGINLVCAAVGIGPDWLGGFIGPGFLDHAPPACSEDQAVALAGIQGLLRACFAQAPAPDVMARAVDWSMLTPPQVRANLLGRVEDFLPEFARLTKPLLVTFGGVDTVVLPAMALALRDRVPTCTLSEYAGVGHAPFLEAPSRFNAELKAFAQQVLATR